MKRNKILFLYDNLCQKHGKPKEQWMLWCKRPKTRQEKEEIVIEAILTQRTNWQNVEKSVASLKEKNKLSLDGIYRLGGKNIDSLGGMIKSSGFYRQKACCLFEISKFFCEKGGVEKVGKKPLEELRESLLEVKGVGPETADDILLYALEKPVFVIDEYTRRFSKKHKLTKDFSYDHLQKLFEKKIDKDYRLYQDLHALIIIEGKNLKTRIN